MEEIRVSHLSKIYHQGEQNEVRALNDVSFTLKKGEFVVILGHSGAGKSTLLNILGGMDTPTSGSYLVGGQDIATFKDKQLTLFRRRDVGFVFQFYNLINNLTALDQSRLRRAPWQLSEPTFWWRATTYRHRSCLGQESGIITLRRANWCPRFENRRLNYRPAF